MTATGELLQDPEQILLRVFEQLQRNPEIVPDIPLDDFPIGSEDRRLLEGFMTLLLRMREGEQTLRNSQQQYEQLVNSLDGIVWEADASTFEFTFVSPQAEAILGYPAARWTTEPTFWQDHIYAEDQSWAPAFCAVATKDKRAHQFEYRMVAADGRIVWLRDIVTVVVEGGRATKLRGVMINVTDRHEQEEQYRSIFEATSDALIINDLEGRVVEVNPAFCKMHGYTYEEALKLDPRQFIHPNSHHLFRDFVESARAGRPFEAHAMDVRKDGTPFHIEVLGSTVLYHGKPHSLAVVRDITTRVQAYEILEQRVVERTRELSTLLDISRDIVSKLELKPLLTQVVERVRDLADYSAAAITVADGEQGLIWQLRIVGDSGQETAGHRIRLSQMQDLWDLVQGGEPVIIPNVRDNSAAARAYRAGIANISGITLERLQEVIDTEMADVGSWLSVPVRLQERVLGMLSLSHPQPGYFTASHAGLLRAVANQAASAIENARLYEQAQEAARATAAQAEIASRVALGGALGATLDDIGAIVVKATAAQAATIGLLDRETGRVHIVSIHGLPDGYGAALNAIMASGTRLLAQEAFSGRQPLILDNMRERLLNTAAYAPLHPFLPQCAWDSIVAVPMVYQDKPVGVLITYHPVERQLGETELRFHTVIANQAAVAVENARLLAEVQSKAALEQRQHLARELHDSVSQALFSINLTARSIEIMLNRQGVGTPDVVAALGDLRQLTGGAMAEMRALIFELRPGALQEEGLVAALRKHAAAIQGRERIAVTITLTGAGDVPRLKPNAEEALYRIAQEALHNIVKHARASEVTIAIGIDPADPRSFTLCVADNGQGFDLSSVPVGHMGLGTMGQRATALGGEYSVSSVIGSGTTIVVHVPRDLWCLEG